MKQAINTEKEEKKISSSNNPINPYYALYLFEVLNYTRISDFFPVLINLQSIHVSTRLRSVDP